MKTTLSILSLLLVLSTAVVVRAHTNVLAPEQTGAEQALLDLERKWAAAGLKNDTAVLADILADDWTSVSAEGEVKTRAQALDELKKSKLTRSELSDMKVRMVNPTTAVVTGVWSGAGTDEMGQKFETKNTIYPNVYDGVEGMLFITQCVASSKDNGGWVPLRHPKSRR